MATKKLKSITVTFRINLEVGMDIKAENLEEALALAKAMKVSDVLNLDGPEHNDSAIAVTWVSYDIPIDLRKT